MTGESSSGWTRRGAVKAVGAACAFTALGRQAWPADSEVAMLVTRKGNPIVSERDLVGLRVCTSTSGKQYIDALLEAGASPALISTAEAPVAFQMGMCDALFFAGDSRRTLLAGAEVLFGGPDNFEAYFVNE